MATDPQNTPNDFADAPRLLAGYFNGTLDTARLAELELWVQADPAHADAFARYAIEQHALENTLKHACVGDLADLTVSEFEPETVDPAELKLVEKDPLNDSSTMDFVIDQALAERRKHELEDEANRQLAAQQAEDARERRFELRRNAETEPAKRTIVIPKSVGWLGLAAAIGLIAWIGWPKHETAQTPPTPPQTAHQDGAQDPQPAPQPVYVARIDASVDAQWEGLGTSEVRLEKGKLLILRHGMAQVTFDDGATVLIEAPATFQPTGTNGMRLVAGRLSAVVPPSGYGFKVVTPHTTLTDLGTEFGVEVDPQSGSATDVFTGRVIAQGPSTGASGRLDLRAGMATRADTAGQLSQVIAADSTAYFRDIETFAAAPRISGAGVYLRSRPDRVAFHTFESSDHISVFLERRAVAWQPGWELDEQIDVELAAGQPVDVYLAHLDPVGSQSREEPDSVCEVVLCFDRPIVGLITSSDLLFATDEKLGHLDTVYPDADGTANALLRGMDVEDDRYVLSDDGQTLTVRLTAGGHIDQLRVVVQSNP